MIRAHKIELRPTQEQLVYFNKCSGRPKTDVVDGSMELLFDDVNINLNLGNNNEAALRDKLLI